ncbi:putative tripartite motif-containing protein 75 [Myotis lucifugus]|uniref:Tripartite motif containing 75, pseudogene n=1 Tax=Myotis lucifugus TaxID=59463 RepID=G1PZI6_MYOLU|nr:putative tripartite motif-containing protein 75 [Myotis lucifugus]
MAGEGAVAKLQTEINCPICLDNLRHPVTIECGHNFCRFCIERSWADVQDRFPCPVCRHPCKERHLWSNTQLGRMVDMAKLLQITGAKVKQQEERRLCEKHNQALTLFCEEDLKLLCPLCTQPPDHQGHHVRPVEEAASHHRQKLRSYIEPLKKQLADLQKLLATQVRQRSELREKVEKRRAKLACEYESVIASIECEQAAVHSRLAAQEKHILQNLTANKAAFSDHISKLRVLRKEMAEMSVLSDVKLLMNIKGVPPRCDNLEPPDVYCIKYKREEFSLPPQCSALLQIMQTFREEVTLDPETAHANLLVSEDKKSVTFVRKKQGVHWNPKGFADDAVVLGSEGFDCGRHYWEVQVDDKPEWAVGVCKDPLSKERKQPLLRQEKRCWTIQLQDGDYVARGPVSVTLVLQEMPRGIGIYLDYEMGHVSFYSLNDMSHIHSFRDTFSEVLKPYFYVGCDPKPLTIRALRD